MKTDNNDGESFAADVDDNDIADVKMHRELSLRINAPSAVLRSDDFLADGSFVKPETRKRFEATNKRWAYVTFGGKARYMQTIPNPEPYEQPYQFVDGKAAAEMMAREPHAVVSKKEAMKVDADEPDAPAFATRTKRIPFFKGWCQWQGRRQYDRAGFYPGREQTDCDVFNVWEGWRIKPKRGSWKKLQRHVWEVVCDRDRAKFVWFMSWLAHVVQTTGDTSRRTPVSPVVWGTPGAGKSLVFDQLVKIFGGHGMTVSQSDQLVGKFNKHLMQSVFVLAEEAVFAHDNRIAGPLKDLMTRDRITIEPKGIDAFEVPNYCRFAFISNSKLVVPMTEGERRYQPFHVSDHRKTDKQWFNAIVAEMRNGGLEAMFYDLRRLKYDEALIRDLIPGSADLAAMRAEAAGPVEQFIVAWFANGYVPTSNPALILIPDKKGNLTEGEMLLGDRVTWFAGETLKLRYDDWCRENLDKHAKTTRDQQRLIGDIRKIFGEKQKLLSRKTDKSTGRMWELASLEECRAWIQTHPVLGPMYLRACEGVA